MLFSVMVTFYQLDMPELSLQFYAKQEVDSGTSFHAG